MIKRIAVFLLCTAVMVSVAACGGNNGSRIVRLTEFGGNVTYTRESLVNQVSKDMTIENSDIITTADDGSAVISMDSDKKLTIRDNTVLSITAGGTEADSVTMLDLNYGEIINEINNPLSKNSLYEVKTPEATVGVYGTTFLVKSEGGKTIVYCDKGLVVITTKIMSEKIDAEGCAVIENDNITIVEAETVIYEISDYSSQLFFGDDTEQETTTEVQTQPDTTPEAVTETSETEATTESSETEATETTTTVVNTTLPPATTTSASTTTAAVTTTTRTSATTKATTTTTTTTTSVATETTTTSADTTEETSVPETTEASETTTTTTKAETTATTTKRIYTGPPLTCRTTDEPTSPSESEQPVETTPDTAPQTTTTVTVPETTTTTISITTTTSAETTSATRPQITTAVVTTSVVTTGKPVTFDSYVPPPIIAE